MSNESLLVKSTCKIQDFESSNINQFRFPYFNFFLFYDSFKGQFALNHLLTSTSRFLHKEQNSVTLNPLKTGKWYKYGSPNGLLRESIAAIIHC